MPQYETKICSPDETGVNLFSMEAFLNLMGKRGWTLATINLKGELVLQREIAINPKIRAYQLKEGEDHDASGSREATGGIPEEGL